MKRYEFRSLLSSSGWLEPAWVDTDSKGRITRISATRPPDADGYERVDGWLVPGFQNGHSHAFQYAMTGLAEHLPDNSSADDFWSWREAMYGLALALEPDEIEAIAAVLYAEMARFGITTVTEFHYLHHDRDGRPYANQAEMGARLMSAAASAGIRLTLVPVYYNQGTFGSPPSPRQRRFISKSVEAYEALLAATCEAAKHCDHVVVGQGVHSLRAATEADAARILSESFAPGPVHVHIAEQIKEVEDCLAAWGKRPVSWLLDSVDLSSRHNLVHATHLDPSETMRLAKTDATVVICPSTEGNLGDGFFPLTSFASQGGRWTIGTDSHISLSPLEDLRWLDYGQRLTARKRNVLCLEAPFDSGAIVFAEAWQRGRLAAGLPAGGYFSIGTELDGVLLDPEHPSLYGKPSARRLSALMYAGDVTAFAGVLRRGNWIVRGGRHTKVAALLPAYQKAMRRLVASAP